MLLNCLPRGDVRRGRPLLQLARRPTPGEDRRVDLRVGENPLLGSGQPGGGAQLVSLSGPGGLDLICVNKATLVVV